MEHQSNKSVVSSGSVEQMFTIPQAAKRLGLPVSLLRRAANSGLLPTHQPFSSRVRVRLSEVIAAIESQLNGGQNNG